MTRAEQKALDAYPGRDIESIAKQTIYEMGYEQAEADHIDYIEKRLENLIDKPGEYNRGAREVLAHLLSKLGGSPAKYFIFKRDCTTCKYGKYNDHWDKHFCYNNEECNNFELYEIDENIDSLERGK